MKLVKITLACALLSTLVCADAPKNSVLDSVVQDGMQATKALGGTLQSQMQAHIKSGGIMGALDFCSTQAYALTQEVNSKLPSHLSVKRVSLKTRNGANAPLSDESKVLKDLESRKELPPYVVEQIDAHTYKFYKPLVIDKPVCLKCHGDISADKTLQSAMNEKYPNDQATSYKMGDLRGAVVVTIKK